MRIIRSMNCLPSLQYKIALKRENKKNMKYEMPRELGEFLAFYALPNS